MNKFLELFLGTTDVPTYAAAALFALIGAIISLRLKAMKRDKLSDNTPFKFSWKFLLQDNFQQLITGGLLTFVAFRFTNDLYGTELTMKLALGIGLGLNEVSGLLGRFQSKARETNP